jgi:Tfp pilus assembly protein PilX
MIRISQRLKSERGIAALLTAVFVAVFLSILTISISDVLNTEQQQTLDVHSSDRAEEAAQAGVEDALARIKYYSTTKDCTYLESDSTPTQCAPPTTLSGNACPSTAATTDNFWEFTENQGNACWIHRNISSTNNVLSGNLAADTGDGSGNFPPSTAQINLAGDTRAIVINWGDPNAYPNKLNSCNQSSPWPSKVAGALELTLITYDGSGNIATPVKGLLMPNVNNGVPCGAASAYDDLYAPPGFANPIGSIGPCPGQFDESNGANNQYDYCSQIQFSPTMMAKYPNAYLRLRARFAADSYQMTALTGKNGSQVQDLPTNSLTIDVTGQAGGVYRRIIAQSTITNPQVYSIFDFVLFSQTDLDKSYACVNAAPTATCN